MSLSFPQSGRTVLALVAASDRLANKYGREMSPLTSPKGLGSVRVIDHAFVFNRRVDLLIVDDARVEAPSVVVRKRGVLRTTTKLVNVHDLQPRYRESLENVHLVRYVSWLIPGVAQVT